MKQIDLEAFSKKKFLITGGLGFVGTNLVIKLLSNKIKPVIIDFLPDEKNSNQDFAPFNMNEVEFYNKDIRNREEILHVVEQVKPDYLIHLASMTNLTKDFQHAHLSVDINIKGSMNLLEAANSQKIAKFILLSSSDVYGGRFYIAGFHADTSDDNEQSRIESIDKTTGE